MKKVGIFILGLLILFSGTMNVKAASASVSVLSSSNKIVVGKTFKITVKVSSSVALGAWEYTLNYDSSMVSLVSSDVSLHYAGYGNGTIKSKSYNYTFKALKSGSAKFNVSKISVIDWNENILSTSNGSRTVTLITQAQLEASYSKNNNLSNLEVSGYEISPKFNKSITTYTVNLSSTINKITIKATKEDSTASIIGTGEFDVSEGLNTFEIKVTAQNGNVQTYTVNVSVEDLNPIRVKVNDENLTIVKRTDLVKCPSTYLESTIKINDTDIPSCNNEPSKYTLIALKNETGAVNLYIYNAQDKSYQKYQELTFSSLIFNPLKYNKEIKGFEQIETKINNEKVNGYTFNSKSEFILLYGKNIETGKTGLYVYDQKENTLQRYDDEQILALEKDLKDYLIIIVIFGSGLLIITIAVIINVIDRKKKERVRKEIAEKKQQEKENKTKLSKTRKIKKIEEKQ